MQLSFLYTSLFQFQRIPSNTQIRFQQSVPLWNTFQNQNQSKNKVPSASASFHELQKQYEKEEIKKMDSKHYPFSLAL